MYHDHITRRRHHCICDICEENRDTTGFLATILFYCLVILTVLVVVAIFTIIGVETASAIWGDYAVTYWLANLF